MSDPVTVKPLTGAAVGPLAAAFSDLPDMPADHFEQLYLSQLLRQQAAFVAWQGADLAGWAALHFESRDTQLWRRSIPEIADLYVAPPRRGQGIGAALLAACEQRARTDGHRQIAVVLAADLPEHTPAYRLVHRAGYRPHRFKGAPAGDRRHWLKSLR